MSVESQQTAPVMHVINYEDGGFVIIAGDKRLNPILAHSDSGNFPSVDENEMPYGLSLWIKHQEEIVQFYNKNDMEQMPDVKATWDNLMGIETASTKAVPIIPPCQDEEEEWITNVGPFLSTQWGQDFGYNDMLGLMNCNGTIDHYLSGCVTTAVAQVLRFYEHPTSYNWSNMQRYRTSVQQLYKDIFDNFASLGAIQSISCTGTAIRIAYIDDLFRAWGYNCTGPTSYNYFNVKEILSAGRPVIACDNNHCWVYDGCRQWYVCSNGTRAGYLQFHVNWGSNGNYDAWYSFDQINFGSETHTPSYYVVAYKIIAS